MNTVQHDTRSLRLLAIQRYLRAYHSIERQHRQMTVYSLLLVILLVMVVCLAVLAKHGRLGS